MNRDEGACQLSPIWNQLISTPNLTPLASLSLEKDGCQALKPSTIILYFLAMLKNLLIL